MPTSIPHGRPTDHPDSLPGPFPRRTSALTATHSPREDLPPIYLDLIERLACETISASTRRVQVSDLRYLAVVTRVTVGEELAFQRARTWSRDSSSITAVK